jgi:DNA gyrase subunit A
VVSALVNLEELGDYQYLVFLTKYGLVKKTKFSCYSSVNYSGISAIKLTGDDELIQVRLVTGNEDIIVFTRDGQGIRFNLSEVRETLRVSQGDRALKLGTHDICAGFTVVQPNDNIVFMLTSKGIGKKTLLSAFPTDYRDGRSLMLIRTMDDDYLVYASSVNLTESITVYTKQEAQIINIEDDNIPLESRIHKGKKILPLKKGDNIIDVTRALQ